jgi:hydrogenase/urease accessory protein HupE
MNHGGMPAATFSDFFRLGIEHILLGFDHLLFLGGLLLVARGWRQLVLVITTFTVAHSLTLALATFNVVSLPGRVAEPLIAASILFVGVENIVKKGEPRARWAVTLFFGLVHG